MLLKKGSTGEDVQVLQEMLEVKTDGIFGVETERLVKSFQASKGLTADGVVGDGTWAALTSLKKFYSVNSDEQEVNTNRLNGHVPDHILEQISETPLVEHFTNNLRLAHFLAQCCHESGNFATTCENLNYSAQGLLKAFPSHFKDPGKAEEYEHNPELIASRVYANRMGNGDEETKDGYTYRGRGYIQLTGKSNYEDFSKYINIDALINPNLVETQYALASAAYYFSANSIWEICDKGSSDDTITKITQIINGGSNGLVERKSIFNRYYTLITT